MGIGIQMIGWDAELCRLIADQGFHVVRFDNRDAGLSTRSGWVGCISSAPRSAGWWRRRRRCDTRPGAESLVSVMSAPAPGIGVGAPEARAALALPPASSEDDAAERAVTALGVVGSPGYPIDEETLASRAREVYRRSNTPPGWPVSTPPPSSPATALPGSPDSSCPSWCSTERRTR